MSLPDVPCVPLVCSSVSAHVLSELPLSHAPGVHSNDLVFVVLSVQSLDLVILPEPMFVNKAASASLPAPLFASVDMYSILLFSCAGC